MKTNLLPVVVCLLLYLSACQSKKEFTIEGTFPIDGFDGRYMYLGKAGVERGKYIPLDSVLIDGQNFRFKGEAPEKAESRHLFMSASGSPLATESVCFALEEGDIRISYAEDYIPFVSGTPVNEAFQNYRTEKNEMMNQAYQFISSVIDTPFGVELAIKNIYLTPEQIVKLDSLSGFQIQKQCEEYAEGRYVLAKMEKPLIGSKYVDFKGITPAGKEIAISNYVGNHKYVLLVFWGTWCGGCIEEIPHLVKAYNQYKDKGLEIISISMDSSDSEWKAMINDKKMIWTQLKEDSLKGKQSTRALYGISSFPCAVLIDKKGTIIAKDLHGDALFKFLNILLGDAQ
jgi:peroxiredoxin